MVKTQKTLLGHTVKQIMARVRTVETIGGSTKRVFCLRCCGGKFLRDFDLVAEQPDRITVASGLAPRLTYWTVMK